MKRGYLTLICLSAMTTAAHAQEYAPEYGVPPVGYGSGVSVGSMEPLYRYDDQERWKHGYLKIMPYYEGFHSFRPYNYQHVFSQSQTAAGWGMSSVLPYSQQFWHKYEGMTDLSQGEHTPVTPYEKPVNEWDHYPQPLRPGASMMPNSATPTVPSTVLTPVQGEAPALPPLSAPEAYYGKAVYANGVNVTE